MYWNLSLRALGIAATQSEAIELALSFGFRGIDLDLVDFADDARTQGLARARRFLDSAKLRLGGFRLPMAVDADEATFTAGLKKLEECVPAAAELDCRRVLVTIAPASDERPFHENFEFHRKRLAAVAAILAPHAITLAVGFDADASRRAGKAFEFVHNLEALQLLLSTVGAKNVGLIASVWDLYVATGSIDGLKAIPRDRIAAVEVADAPADKAPESCASGDRLIPGAGGAISMPEVLSILSEAGYNGPVTPAPSRAGLGNLRRDQAVRSMGEALSAAWKAAGLSTAGRVSAKAQS
jgi:sugar phosphate isomerase/epimerase